MKNQLLRYEKLTPYSFVTNMVSFDKTQATATTNAKTEAELISCRVSLCLIVTMFEANTSHLAKNRQLEINPTAQKRRHNTSFTVIVINP